MVQNRSAQKIKINKKITKKVDCKQKINNFA